MTERLDRQVAGLAQLVEQLICNHQVAGSTPAAGTTFPPLKQHIRKISFLSAFHFCNDLATNALPRLDMR